MTKRKNPYDMVLKEAMQFAFEVQNPIQKPMFSFRREKLDNGWRLTEIYERTLAASQLGFDVVFIATDTGLELTYRKKQKFQGGSNDRQAHFIVPCTDYC